MNWAESLYINGRLRRARLRGKVVPSLIELGGRTDGLEVFDVGCGPGECVAFELEAFGASTVKAIDLDPKMVAKAERRLATFGDRASVSLGDVTHLDYQDGQFPAVFNFAVLHHVPDWRRALAEIARVLEPGGRLFSQDHDVAHHDWLSRQLFVHPPDRFSNAQFLEQIDACGLDPVGVDDEPAQLLLVARKRE
jgi:ubiquinone/menaquinone biosynthesis C-methylase UbiE